MSTPRTSPSQKQKRKLQEKTRLLAHAKMLEVKIAEIQTKLIGVQDEIADTQARNYHLFSLLHSHRNPVLLKVWGAEDADAACHIAHDVARDFRPYTVLVGDQTEGKARVVYQWCSPRAQVVNARMMSRHLEGPLLHIVLRPTCGDSLHE